MTTPDRTLYVGYRRDVPTVRDTTKPFAKVDWYADTDTYIWTYLVDREVGQRRIFPDKGFTCQGIFSFLSNRTLPKSRPRFPLFPLVYVKGQEPRHTSSYEEYIAQFGCTKETYHPFDELDWHHGWRATDNYYFSLDTSYWSSNFIET